MVSVVVACGAAKLGCHLTSLELCELLCEAIYKHHDLLAQTCGRGRLSVGLCQHGHVLPLVSILLQLCYQLLHQRAVHVLQRLLH